MTITRRLFLGGLLASTCAPAIVRSGVLMPVRPVIVLPGPISLWDQGTYDTIVPVDISVTIEDYLKQAGERMALVNEMIVAGVLRNGLGKRGHVKAKFEQRRINYNEHWMVAFKGRA